MSTANRIFEGAVALHRMEIDSFQRRRQAKLSAMLIKEVPADYVTQRIRFTLELRAMLAWHEAHCEDDPGELIE